MLNQYIYSTVYSHLSPFVGILTPSHLSHFIVNSLKTRFTFTTITIIEQMQQGCTYCMEHIHTGLPSICMFQGRDQGRHLALPPLHTGYDCCTCMRKKRKFKYKSELHEKKKNTWACAKTNVYAIILP